MDELVEERPVPGALVRHRGARMEQHGVERSAPRLEVHAGAVWIRATDAGPGILASHGATTVQVREGAAVLEVSDFEALLVVVSGRAAVKGAAALPRSVTGGNAVVLNLDGGFGTPEPLTADELRADWFVVENLARDVLAEVGAAPPEAPPAPTPPRPAPVRSLTAPAGARVDGSPPAVAEAPVVPVEPPPAAEPEDEPIGGGAAYDPAPIAVPGPGAPADAPDDEAVLDLPHPARRGLIAVVIVLVLLAAVIGALVLTRDDARSAPPLDEPAPATEPIAATTSPPEATLQACEPGAAGYVAQGVVSGGGPGVARYEVGVGLEGGDGALDAEKAVTVAARTDPSIEVRWTVELTLADGEARPGSECRITRVDAVA